MNLSKYPRPKNDTGLGFRLPPGQYDRLGADHWLPELRATGATWVVLNSQHPASIPASLLMDLIGRGLEAVVQVGVTPVARLEGSLLSNMLHKYRDCGVHYVSVYDRPNSASQWSLAEWRRPALVQRFMDMLLPILERAAEAGLYPVLSALEPGGDYWDTAFLAGLLGEMKGRGKSPLFDRLAIGVYNYAFNRPLSWGKGGQARWKDCLPYYTPPGSEDHKGFWVFQWYDEIVREQVGYSLPLISLGSGAAIGPWEDPSLPPLDQETAAQRNQELARLLMEGELSDCLFNHAFPLAEEESSGAALGRKTTLAKALQGLPKHPRYFSWDKPREAAPGSVLPKHLHHYVLFPPDDRGRVVEWRESQNYIHRFRPTCGFRLEEAMQAEFVTIVGDGLGISPQEEREIRAAGCKVERIAGRNGKETKRLLDQMASSGKRFLTF